MPLYLVHSYGGVETDREGRYDPVELVGRSRLANTDKPITIELFATDTEEGVEFLRRQPNVISIEQAQNGMFEDDTEGLIEVIENGMSWRPARESTPPQGRTRRA